MPEVNACHIESTRIDVVQNVQDKSWTVRVVNRANRDVTVVLASGHDKVDKEGAATRAMMNLARLHQGVEQQLVAFGATPPLLPPQPDGHIALTREFAIQIAEYHRRALSAEHGEIPEWVLAAMTSAFADGWRASLDVERGRHA